MKNIIVGIVTLLTLALMLYLAMTKSTYQGGEHAKVIQDISSLSKKEPRISEDEKTLKSLQNKAGSVKTFEISLMYKKRCASCHGVNAEGIMGPKLLGLKADDIYQKLLDYKAGRIENAVMKGLLINLKKEELRSLADEIGTFGTKN